MSDKPVDFVKKKHAKILEDYIVRLNEVRNNAIDTIDLIDEVFEVLGIEIEEIDDDEDCE